ncbi:hypothetical protein [Mycobacterium sp. CnD-18-1]|uniref:hypothetical protein n=1 Tax=Mycobacterium sp. CnD-18-1 TaxID=2917744 RepID=UPI001EF2BB3D|nr:hypothetical protein [Mycobacterium sp. CnD-18-1]MCG7607104.1 hypothetical protein [Mycobacterium sp. CnD-18-1]
MLKKLAAVLALTIIGVVVAPAASVPLVIKTAWDDNDDPVLVDDFTSAVNNVAKKFPEVRGITVTSQYLGPGVYAVAGGRRIALNDLYASSSLTVNLMFQYDVQEGFHPQPGRCSAGEFLAYHEAAHIIDQAKGTVPRMEVAVTYGRGEFLTLSGYSFYRDGGLNPGEALAEAFASVLCNGGNASEQALYDILVEVKPATA